MASFRYTVADEPAVATSLRRHIGARRFAYNRCLQAVKDALEDRGRDPSHEVPWSGFDLINWFNAWKKSEEAGRVWSVDSAGHTELVGSGLSWQHQVSAQVFEEAAVDLGRALSAFRSSRKQTRRGPRVGFPRFSKKATGAGSFRLRNKTSASGRHSIRLGEAGPRVVSLPVVGDLRVREETRRLRRLLRPGNDGEPRGRICYATVSQRGSRFVLSLTCELADLHPAMRHPAHGPRRFVGMDRGISAYAVLADAEGNELSRVASPKPLARSLPKLRRASRAASRKVPGSQNHAKAARRLRALHTRIANKRRDFTHRTSRHLVKTHDAICIEDLAVRNLLRNRHLARSISDVALGELGRQLAYKAPWYGTELVLAPRFFPSSRTCSSCGWTWKDMDLTERAFCCGGCGLRKDRDTNAAANLAAWGEAEHHSASQAPDPEARGRVTNACGGRSAGRHRGGGETTSETPQRGQKQEPAKTASVL